MLLLLVLRSISMKTYKGIDSTTILLMVITALVFCDIIHVNGYPDGAPFKTCVNRFPKHSSGQQQHTPAPYTISINSSSYTPGHTLTVTLEGAGGAAFRGFQVVAQRTVGDVEEAVGRFSLSDQSNSAQLQFWYPSTPGEYNCVSHTDASEKSLIRLLWTAPNVSVGDVIFRGGFVKDYDTFWANVESNVIKSDIPVTTPPGYPGKVNSVVSPDDFTAGCGVSKGCFKYPTGCHGDCKYAITYERQPGNRILIGLMGAAEGYISVGFSDDKLMGNDSVVVCASKDDIHNVQYGWSPRKYIDRHRVTQISDISIATIDGRIYCSFVRPINATFAYIDQTGDSARMVTRAFDLDRPQYLFLAWGDLYWGSDVPEKHMELPLVSTQRINVAEMESSTGQSLPTELQIHAMLGLLAWLLLAGFLMILPRHYRDDLKRPVFGAAVWFQAHRTLAFVVAALTASGVILIFVSLRAWTEHATIHAVMGLVTLGLALMQLTGGMCRPGPQSSRRPVFNWIHRLSGVGAYIAAAVTMILGAQNTLLLPSLRNKETILIAVGISIQVALLVVLEIAKWKCHNTSDTWTPKSDMQMEEKKSGSENDGWSLRLAVLIIYLISMLPITVLALFFIFSL